MPQLINPIVPDLRSPTPRVPEDSVPAAAFRLGNELQDKTLAVADTLLKQQQIQKDHGALTYLTSGLANLETSLNDIPNPQEKLKAYNEGLNSLITETHQEFPGISPFADENLMKTVAINRRGVIGRLYRLADEQGKEDYVNKLKIASEQAADAQSPEEMKMVLKNATDRIDFEQQIGTVSPAKAQYDKDVLRYQVNEALIQRQLVTDPKQVLAMTHEEAGIPWERFRELQNLARTHLFEQDDIAKKQKEHEHFELLQMLNSDPDQARSKPQMMFDYLRTGKISRKEYEGIMGARPTNPDLRESIYRALTEPNAFKTQEELDNFARENIFGATELASSDRAYLMKGYSQVKEKIHDEQAKHEDEIIFNFRQDLMDRLGPAFRDPINKEKYRSLVHGLRIELKHSKSIEDQNKARERFDATVTKIFPKYNPLYNQTGKQVDPALIKAWEKDISQNPVSTPAEEESEGEEKLEPAEEPGEE